MNRRNLVLGVAATALCSGKEGAADNTLSILRSPDLWAVRWGTRELLCYRVAPVKGPPGTKPLFARNAYFHPVRALNGAMVTDDFPPDHLHQRGIFFAWTKTHMNRDGVELQPDFWNIGGGSARIRNLGIKGEIEKTGDARLTMTHLWEARNQDAWVPVLDEHLEMRVHSINATNPDDSSASYRFDLTFRQTARFNLELPEYRYGGMAIRGARAWEDRVTSKLTTSEGKGWSDGEGTTAHWVDQSGPVDGTTAGIAMIEHPSNPGSPARLRVPERHPYAVYCPSKAANLLLEAGREYQFRYALLVHNGMAPPAMLNSITKEYRQSR